MAFIPADKMKALREAALKGDERAKNIINKHFQKKDYSADLEDFFKPKQENKEISMPATDPGEMPENVSTGNPKLDEFLKGNGVKKGDEDYDDAVEDYYREFPNERPATSESKAENLVESNPTNADVKEELDMTADMGRQLINLISVCDQTLIAVSQNDDIDDTTRKGAMTSLQEIKQSLFDSAEKIKKIKSSLSKKEEKDL